MNIGRHVSTSDALTTSTSESTCVRLFLVVMPRNFFFLCSCRFQGTPEEIEGHLNTCKYEGVKV